MPKKIAISMGDPNGIGPEIILKTLLKSDHEKAIPVIFGREDIFSRTLSELTSDVSINPVSSPSEAQEGKINLIPCIDDLSSELTIGQTSAVGGQNAMKAVEDGIDACLRSETSALVTAPISKEAITLAGYDVPGHTEYLARKTSTDEVLMMLVSGDFRVALATIHIPVRQIADTLTEKLLKTRLTILHDALQNDFGIPEPSIAVMGLNPHGGDGGVIGREEIDLIRPVLSELKQKGFAIDGPFAADAFFGQSLHKSYDAVFAMYHDQGLVPFKALTFGRGVNVTAGLPIIRTSPDHGTAFDIAGKLSANEGSFTEAYNLAVQLADKK
jgi:4-hydroxythreonine-4-phosphate dehydrogenase